MKFEDDSYFPPVTRGMFAMELADRFLLEPPNKSPEEEEMTRSTILMAAEYLAGTAGPLRWESFEPVGFFEAVGFMSQRELVGVGLVLMGFFGWMCCHELLDGASASRIFDAVKEAAPRSPILTDLHRSAERLVSGMESDRASLN